MNTYLRPTGSWRPVLALVISTFVLFGCGGGGGDTAPAPSAAAPILDSFGSVVSVGFGEGDSGGDGTAGDGAAIPNRPVLLTDASGKTATATTSLQGYYRLNLSGFTPPFVVKVTKADGSTRTSLSTAALKRNGFITINITGLTEKIASDVAIAGGKKGAADLTPAIVSANAGAIQTAINKLKTDLAAQISAAGVDAATFDPIAVPFRTDSTGYDKILDSVKVTLAPDGSTVVTPTTGTTAPTTGYSGNWRLSVGVNGAAPIDTGVVPGASILTASALAAANASANSSAVVGAIVPSSTNVGGYTLVTNGNTSTMTGPSTNLTIVINSFSFSNYALVGSGAVGSKVTYRLNVNYTFNGTLDGTAFNNQTLDVGVDYAATREN